MATTIKLELAYQNAYGKLLINKDYRIFTIECPGNTEEEKCDNLDKFIQSHNEDVETFANLLKENPNDETYNQIYRDVFEAKLFMNDPDTQGIVKYNKEWNPMEITLKMMLKNFLSKLEENEE